MWELDHQEDWAPKNWCFWTVVLEKTLESPLDRKKIKPVNPKGNHLTLNTHWKDWCWSWSSNTLATWWEQLIHWKRCWERMKAKGEAGGRGWEDWIASLTRWTRIWANSGRWWRTGKPGVLQCLESQRVRHDLVTEEQQLLDTAQANKLAMLVFNKTYLYHLRVNKTHNICLWKGIYMCTYVFYSIY